MYDFDEYNEQDDYEEYCIECDGLDEHHYPGCSREGMYGSGSSSGGNMSTIGALGCTVGGFILTALILKWLSVDIDNMSTFGLVLVLTIVCSLLGAVVSVFKK